MSLADIWNKMTKNKVAFCKKMQNIKFLLYDLLYNFY